MNLYSYIVLGVLAVWFIFAVIWIVRRRGNPCAGCKSGGCGACKSNDCAACPHCRK